jgi:hypothetical protein
MTTEVERFMSAGHALADIRNLPAGQGRWQRQYSASQAGTVILGQMLAQVAVVPVNAGRCTLTAVDGDPEMLAALTARPEGGALRIEGAIPFKPGSGHGPFRGTFFGSGVTVITGGSFSYSASSGGGGHAVIIDGREVDLSHYIRLVLAVPPATSLRVSDLLGTIAITGDLQGSVDFSPSFLAQLIAPGSVGSLTGDLTGSGSAMLGAVTGDTDLEVSGSGSFRIGEVLGSVTAKVSGSGSVAIGGGTSTRLRASVSGSGTVAHQGVTTGDARLRVSGSGQVHAATVCGAVDPKVTGCGSITANGRTYRPRW